MEGERRFTNDGHFFFLFSLIWCATKIFNPSLRDFFHYATVSMKRINMITILCASRLCIKVGVTSTSSMPQTYINCQKLHRFSCVLTASSIPSSRGNKISQTAQLSGLIFCSTNVDTHRLWHDFPWFFDTFLTQIYIAHETLKMQGLHSGLL